MISLLRSKYFLLVFIFFLGINLAASDEVQPVLEFPEKGMDDPAKYEKYVTRFFKDSAGNSLQIYIDQKSGRVVNLWANAANESLSFTVRDTAGQPVAIQWNSKSAIVTSEKNTRSVQYDLTISSPSIQIGHTLLGSMRKERDFQYFKKHLQPYDAEPFHEEELKKLIANLDQMPEDVRREHLRILNAKSTSELRSRLDPVRSLDKADGGWRSRLNQSYFDDKNHLVLELRVSDPQTADLTRSAIAFRSADETSNIKLTVKISTDSTALTPLDQRNIFNSEFNKFYQAQKTEKDPIRFKWLEREIRGFELLSSQDKLMAGLPNFATYFGRDTMMASLMMEPIWTGAMLEHAIGSVLNKLSPAGAVSHEEALGGQAIRENADIYNKHIETKSLDQAKSVLQNLNAVRENYKMVDDDFQLPVLVGKYLQRKDVTNDQKREYFLRKSRQDVPFLTLLVRNLVYVVKDASPYIENPVATNLVKFPIENGRCISSSWRDSGVGYAGGCFAMDVNVVWVPESLEAIGDILSELEKIGFSNSDLESRVPEIRTTKFHEYTKSSEALKNAIKIWKGAGKHFEVHLKDDQIRQGIKAKLAWLPEAERNHWAKILPNIKATDLKFLALSLDENGKPIPVVNSDHATFLFVEDFTEPDKVTALTDVFDVQYPVGLFVEGLGPLCANDTFASPEVWEMFKDLYHSPRVVWGREVNLLQLGLLKQIQAATKSTDVERLRTTLKRTVEAVEASGLKHNELWTYKIEENQLKPVRYGTSTDIQLWNLTDLAVQFLMNRAQR